MQNSVIFLAQISLGLEALNTVVRALVGALLRGLTLGNFVPFSYTMDYSLLSSLGFNRDVLTIWIDSCYALCLLLISLSIDLH